MRSAILILACLVLSLPAAAHQQKYASWIDPGAPKVNEQLQEFIGRLKGLIDEAESSRAANPRFLRDLRNLAEGVDRPWRKNVLFDDFSDGDYTAAPVWAVTGGRFEIVHDWGLRSIVQAAPARKNLSGEQAAFVFLGQILEKSLRKKETAGKPGGDAAIHVPAAISNAFAIKVELSSWKPDGLFEFGPYLGEADGAGYSLSYRPGRPLELLSVSGRGGARVIDRGLAPLTLEDKRAHFIEWTRHADGRMAVSVDATEVLTTQDRGFAGAFDGFRLVNQGSDFIVRSVSIEGVE
jgi:hypothetical protein